MAYTVKLIRSDPDKVESDLKTYLDAQSPTTIHNIQHIKFGNVIYTYVVFE